MSPRRHVIVAPQRMPLGDYVMRMPWRVNALEAERITVCCPPLWRLLFPRADDFIDTPERCGAGTLEGIVKEAARRHPEAEVVHFKNGARESRPVLRVEPRAGVDVVIAPRFKQDEGTRHRNWGHWAALCGWLQGQGLRVVAAGRAEMSAQVPCESAETVNEMMRCVKGARLVIATDSAVAHLAVLLEAPLAVIWGRPAGCIPGQAYAKGCHRVMNRQRKGPLWHLEDTWESFDQARRALAPLLAWQGR